MKFCATFAAWSKEHYPLEFHSTTTCHVSISAQQHSRDSVHVLDLKLAGCRTLLGPDGLGTRRFFHMSAYAALRQRSRRPIDPPAQAPISPISPLTGGHLPASTPDALFKWPDRDQPPVRAAAIQVPAS